MKNTLVDRVKKRRDALRAAGLRPVQIWIPDTRRRGFARECRRQSLSLRGDPQESRILRWLNKVADAEGWK
ncbi:MAG TPA: antitoxin MazE family protein [Terriglobia bacterium]